MKILYVITLPEVGGAQVHLIELISNLPIGVKAAVVVGKRGWLTDKLGQREVACFVEPSLVRPISPLRDLRAILQLCALIRRERPDLVHCHSSKAGIVGRIAARLCGVPALFTAHGWAFTEGVSPWKRIFYQTVEKQIARISERILCVSEYDRKLALQVMPEEARKLVTVHNGIADCSRKQMAAFKEDGVLRLAMIARFTVQKDYATLLRALFLLQEKKVPFKAALVGDGPHLAQMQQMARAFGLQARVAFLGARADIEEILRQQDVFVLSSRWEGLPISILEAMRQGLPIIATDVGGVREAVQDNGFLVPRGDAEALAVRLEALQSDSALRQKMGKNSRKRYEMYFTSRVMERKIVSVYSEVTAR